MAYKCSICGNNEKSIILGFGGAKRRLYGYDITKLLLRWFCYICNHVTEHIWVEEHTKLGRDGIRPVI